MKKIFATLLTLILALSCVAALAATEADLPTEPEFDPNPDYDKWTVVEYTIEDIQADLVCTVSAKEDNSEFYLECNFYGDDQMTRTTFDGTNYPPLTPPPRLSCPPSRSSTPTPIMTSTPWWSIPSRTSRLTWCAPFPARPTTASSIWSATSTATTR